jgi:hypothetical protein
MDGTEDIDGKDLLYLVLGDGESIAIAANSCIVDCVLISGTNTARSGVEAGFTYPECRFCFHQMRGGFLVPNVQPRWALLRQQLRR